MTYLADTSMVIRLHRNRDIAPRWVDKVRAGLVGVCPVIEAELTRAAGSKADLAHLRTTLHSLFVWHPMPDSAWRFIERTQEGLAQRGHHQGPSVVDLLVAATAAAWDLTVLHVDADFDAIAAVAGIRVQRADRDSVTTSG